MRSFVLQVVSHQKNRGRWSLSVFVHSKLFDVQAPIEMGHLPKSKVLTVLTYSRTPSNKDEDNKKHDVSRLSNAHETGHWKFPSAVAFQQRLWKESLKRAKFELDDLWLTEAFNREENCQWGRKSQLLNIKHIFNQRRWMGIFNGTWLG